MCDERGKAIYSRNRRKSHLAALVLLLAASYAAGYCVGVLVRRNRRAADFWRGGDQTDENDCKFTSTANNWRVVNVIRGAEGNLRGRRTNCMVWQTNLRAGSQIRS